MKKIIAFVFALCSLLFLYSCEKDQGLLPYLSEVRTDILTGESENYSVKACVIKTESPLTDDGKTEKLIPFLRFFLKAEDLNAVYKIDFIIGENAYSRDFSLDPASGEFTASVETDELTQKTLDVRISCAGNVESINLTSIVPENALTHTAVLDAVLLNNPELFNAYRDEEGNFLAEIRLKITVKDDKPYYFFGIVDGKSRKAFLADGITGEVLAIRNVF